MGASSEKVVLTALVGNFAIAVAKFMASVYTGSSSMLSEGIHSLVDSANQGLLLFGLKRSQKNPDENHPLGYGKELYFWAFIVAILIFGVGGGFSIYEGIHKLGEEHHLITNPFINYGVLSFAFIVEGYALWVAVKEFNVKRGDTPLYQAIQDSKDPATYTVLLEDGAALAGIFIAFLGTFLSHVFHFHMADAISAICIGVLLCAVAVVMAIETKSLLIGEAASKTVQEKIEKILNIDNDPNILQLNEIITLQVAPYNILVIISVDFADHLDSIQVEKLVSDLDTSIKKECPDVKRVFIEAQNTFAHLEIIREAKVCENQEKT